MNEKKLYRSRDERKIAGVAGGLAEHLNIDPVIVRIIFVCLFFCGLSGGLIYLILWIVIPEKPWFATNEPQEPVVNKEEMKDSEPINSNTNTINMDLPAEETKQPEKRGNRLNITGGVILITIGILFLCDKLIPSIHFVDLWPVLLIVIGITVIFNRRYSKKPKTNNNKPSTIFRNILWGVVLIGVGVMFILRNLGLIHFHWHFIMQLWPLLLVIWGISIIPIKDYIKLILSIITIIVAILVIEYYQTNVYFDGDSWRGDTHRSKNWKELDINEKYDSAITKATLNFEVAAGNFNIAGTTDKLIDFDNKDKLSNYKIFSVRKDNSKIINIESEKNVVNINSSSNVNSAIVRLNQNPEWDINVEEGMSDLNLDLSMFKINNVNIQGGMSNISLKFGAGNKRINLLVEATASSVNILIPEESGCEVLADNILSSKDMPDFKKVSENTYQSEGFVAKQNKIFITVDAAISNLNIKRY